MEAQIDHSEDDGSSTRQRVGMGHGLCSQPPQFGVGAPAPGHCIRAAFFGRSIWRPRSPSLGQFFWPLVPSTSVHGDCSGQSYIDCSRTYCRLVQWCFSLGCSALRVVAEEQVDVVAGLLRISISWHSGESPGFASEQPSMSRFREHGGRVATRVVSNRRCGVLLAEQIVLAVFWNPRGVLIASGVIEICSEARPTAGHLGIFSKKF